jgi:hypothetical protein
MIVYKRSPTIAGKIFNYKQIVNSINCEEWIQNDNACECQSSPFCDPVHKHIVTGDLRVIKNNRLRSLLSKGPKYREQERIRWDKVLDSIKAGITDCQESWSQREHVDRKVLNQWSTTLLEEVKSKISKIQQIILVKDSVIPLLRKYLIVTK